MKHAYLILAHNSATMLQRLISTLDDCRNDIYIHLDKKFDINIDELTTNHSKLTVLPTRLDARWGDFSLVEAEYLLYKEAFNAGPYAYYHLISGVDFPIKSQDYIHDFCDSYKGREFIGFAFHTPEREIQWRSQHYFLFSRDFKSTNVFKKLVRSSFARLQSLVKYKRTDLDVKKGCQWTSITHDFVDYIIKNEQLVYQIFNHTYCPDEFFVQTLCWNSPFRQNIFDLTNEFSGCRRYIIWINGEIQTLDNENPAKMVNSDRWFARKFSEKGISTINDIYSLIQL